MFSITVPASTANLGPGFDSIGLAIDRYLHLDVEQASNWLFECQSPGLEKIGSSNLITEAAMFAANQLGVDLPPCKVTMDNGIPLSKGFGSSAAATVAGIELTCNFSTNPVSKKKKARLATMFEGHPDNVAASIYGGLVIGAHRADATDILHVEAPEVELVAFIPGRTLATKKARGVLPEKIAFTEAVRASAIANVMAGALVTNNWELAGKMMMEDLFHQPYRQELIPHMTKICEFAKADVDVYGAALSGAGPIILCYTEKQKGGSFARRLQEAFPGNEVVVLKPALNGAAVSVIQA
ncbi:homoserine kinase [Shouchella patagoniensis]|uniref:homoserine kinase n=1 Tax=Shouchella patagoniensis TaxID=228576 RepID=UPI0034626EA5